MRKNATKLDVALSKTNLHQMEAPFSIPEEKSATDQCTNITNGFEGLHKRFVMINIALYFFFIWRVSLVIQTKKNIKRTTEQDNKM